MGKYLLILVSFLSYAACKQEPVYQLKDPYGAGTMSAKADEFDDVGVDQLKIRKKNFDRQKWNEKERKNRAIRKVIKQARDWDPKQRR